jgi:membrane protein implicated in regulation of membrane protease activity
MRANISCGTPQELPMNRRFAYRTIDLRPLGAGGWRLWLGMAVGATVAVALLLTFGLIFLLLLPVFAVLGVIGRWWLGRELRKAARQTPRGPAVIEGQYEIVEAETPVGRGWGPRR